MVFGKALPQHAGGPDVNAIDGELGVAPTQVHCSAVLGLLNLSQVCRILPERQSMQTLDQMVRK